MRRRNVSYQFLRFVERIIAIVLALIVLIIAVGFIPFSPAMLTERVEKAARRKGLDSCSIERVTFSLWQGAKARRVYIEKRLSDTAKVVLIAPRAIAVLRPLYIFANRDSYKHFLDELFPSRTGVPPSARKKREKKSGARITDAALLPAIKKVVLGGSILRLKRTGKEDFACMDFEARIVIGSSAAPAVKMRCKAEEAEWGTWRIDKPKATLIVEKKCLIVEKLNGSIFDGKISGSARLIPEKAFIQKANLSMRGFDLEKMYEARKRKEGTLSGFADVNLRIEHQQWDDDSLKCSGNFVLSKLEPDRVPVLTTIVVSLTVPQLSKLYFKRVRGDVLVAGERIHCTNVKGEGEPVSLESSGWVRPDGYFEFNVGCSFKAEYKDSLAPIAWDAMIPQDDDGRRFECTITGTWDKPRVRLSRRIARRAVRSVFSNIKQGLRSVFK